MPVTNFKDWFHEHLADWAEDIANHGADAGYPHITYTSDCVKVFDQFEDDIWEMACDMADELSCKNVAEMISGFQRSDMLGSVAQFKNLMVWFACEEVARSFEHEKED